jgi:hypothetical protein
MNRLLTVAELIAGRSARQRVFEPLLADWQRQLQHADSPSARLTVAASGAVAFARALAICAVIDGAWMPPLRVSLTSLAAITFAVLISIGVLLIAPVPQDVPRDLSEPLVQRWILVWAGILLPPAFLLATFLLRRDARCTQRHAALVTLLAAAATALVVVNSTDDALRRRYDTFEVQEHMRELALARHRAGAPVFAGDRYRRTMQTTVAERRANFERYRARMAAHRQDPPPTWRDRFAQLRPVLLAIIFSMIGWMLAGLGHATVPRAFGWWALVFVATITLTRIFWLVVRVPMPRIPEWLMPALFTFVACALAIHALRSYNSERPS